MKVLAFLVLWKIVISLKKYDFQWLLAQSSFETKISSQVRLKLTLIVTKVLGFSLENFLRYLTWKTFLWESKTGTLGSGSTFHWEPVNHISSFYLLKFRSNGWKSMFFKIFLIKPSNLPKVGTNMKPCPKEFFGMTLLLV